MLTLVPSAEAAAAAAPAAAQASPALPLVVVALLGLEALLTLVGGLYLFFVRPRGSDRVSPRILAGFVLGWTAWSIALAMAATWSYAQWGIGLNVLWLAGSAIVLVFVRPRVGSTPPGVSMGSP